MADPVNAETVHLIMRNEGRVRHSYQDSVGVWTCCDGHTGPEVGPGMTYTDPQCNAILEQDLAKFEDGVDGLVGDADTSENEFGAMVSLAYNIGLAAFGRSSVLRLHNSGDKAGAADAFLLWNKARGEVLAGLDRRRHEERALYLKPDSDLPSPSVLVTAPPRDDRPGMIAWIAELLGVGR